jgi:hypothetical protein
MTLLEARTEVRKATRHVNDTVRLTDARLDQILNNRYRELKTELQELAPSLGLVTGPELTVPVGEEISDGNVERVVRVERRVPASIFATGVERWLPVPMADIVDPEQNMGSTVAWEERGNCIILHPEGEVGSAEYGVFRVLYYPLTADLTDADHVFQFPYTVKMVFINRCCADVLTDDGDANKADVFKKNAQESLERAMPALAKRYGVHSVETFRSVLGY